MKKNDVVVIGSGISGLLTALALSREGKKVLILEKEDCIGGVCRSYEVDGYRLDTGPHAITRLKSGPLKVLMDRYFRVVPQFAPFGKYYVRIGDEVKPFPWSINSWLTFSLIPMTDRLLLMRALFNTLYLLNSGKDFSNIPLSAVLPNALSSTTRRFLDWLCYFMVGTSADNAPISRFIDNKIHNTHSVPYVGKLYDLFITDGAKDQGYPKGGLQSIINSVTSSFPEGRVKIITNERVVKIEGIRREDQVFRADQVITNRDSYECDTVVYSGFSSRLPDLVDDLPSEYTENLSSIKKVKSLTIWLGLTKRLFLNYGSEMWVDSDPYAWVVPTTNYDPTLAPRGNHLVGFAFTLDGKYDMAKIKKKAFQSIVGKVPDIEDHIDMIHYQELVPEKASWGLNLGFGDVRTPVKNLYCVGTDTAKRSAGVNRSAYSVLKCLDLMRSDGVLR
ncbi:MAG: NAD(P)/FAD-dependent oxidoreductase [Methanothrix sp.]|uniref:phytoene desaturase family protein n=1 Tax=Methanothrix sp. TaxID=90426 RepID=UPI001B612AA3|nr:NAD(P)/FAD-dependent oxidoreductase [Methanothrix sp.]MBP7069075.1 NAD(P)/FAD-dependent oxidoreductase [Methanothrix sp.]